MASAEHYNAFISYRHNERDSRAAGAIQRGLEHFRIPAAVRRSTGIRRIERIFRDKEELPITTDLGENIDRALACSDFLIVICSPELQESRWCMREIEVFLSMHPRNRVLTVVTEGEPSDVIPPVLLKTQQKVTDPETGEILVREVPVEPLSCDYRRAAGSGSRRDFREAERTELPRLAAVMLGCSYDELVRRQHQYRMRRLAVTGGTVFAAAALAIGYLAWSRHEIRQNYQQALINESRELAVKSLNSLADEDRVNAVRLALEALPSEDRLRPVTAEAEYALTEALQVYSSDSGLKGTRIFSARDRILEYAYSADGKYLLAMDRSGALTVWDIGKKERVTVWEMKREEDVPSFAVLSEDRAVVWFGNIVFSMDYLSGDQTWKQELDHSGVSVCLSEDGRTVFVENRKDLYVFDCETGSCLSRFSPEEGGIPEEGYFYGIRPGPDGKTAAVLFRHTDDPENYDLYCWDTGSGLIRKLNTGIPYRGVSQFGWMNGGRIFICCREADDSDFSGGKVVSVGAAPLTVACVDAELEKEIWKADFEFAQEGTRVSAIPSSYTGDGMTARNGLLVTYGQSVLTLDAETGECVLRRDLGEEVLSLLEAAPDHYVAVLGSGQTVSVFYSPRRVIYYKQFAGGISMALLPPAEGSRQALVLKDGAVLLYEQSDSEAYTASSGEVGTQPVREGTAVVNRDGSARYIAALTQEPGILITDCASMKTAAVPLPGDPYEWKICAVSDTGRIILARSEKTLSFYSLDPSDGSLSLLPAQDAAPEADYGLFFAGYGHFFAEQDGKIWYCGGRSLRSLDERSGEIGTLEIHGLAEEDSLRNSCRRDLISYGTLVMPAPVFISGSGSHILTTVFNEKENDTRGILIRTSDGSFVILEKLLYDGILSAAFDGKEKKAAVAGNFLINVYDLEGRLLTQIPHAGKRVLSMTYREDELLVLYSDKTLVRYLPDGTPAGTTVLDFPDNPMGIYERIRWDFSKDRLYLGIDDALCVIDAKTWPQQQSAAVSDYLVRTEEGIWNTTAEADKDYTACYRIGLFRELSVGELVDLGRKMTE